MAEQMNTWISYWIYCTGGLVVTLVIIGPQYMFKLRYYASIFLAVMYMTYVVRPVLAFTVGDGLTLFEKLLPGISILATQDATPMAGIFSASLVCFAIGYRIIGVRSALHPSSAAFSQTPENTKLTYVRFAALLIIFGYLSFFIAQRGFLGMGESTPTFNKTSGGTGYANTTGYVELANYFVVSGVLLYYATTNRLLTTILLSSPWALNQIYRGWSRYVFFVLAFGIFAVWLSKRDLHKRLRGQGLLVVTIAVFTVFLISSMRSNRHFLRSRGTTLADLVHTTSQMPVDQMLGDLSGFEGTWFVYRTMKYRIPRYGASLVYQFLIKPVPRIFWAGKPFPGEFTWEFIFGNPEMSPSGLEISLFELDESRFYTAFVAGSIGGALKEWGWLGIPLNFFVTGLFLAWMEKRVSVSTRSEPWIAAYAATYGLLAMLGRNTIFDNQSSTFVLFFFVPYAFIYWWAARQSRRAHPLLSLRVGQKQLRDHQELKRGRTSTGPYCQVRKYGR